MVWINLSAYYDTEDGQARERPEGVPRGDKSEVLISYWPVFDLLSRYIDFMNSSRFPQDVQLCFRVILGNQNI